MHVIAAKLTNMMRLIMHVFKLHLGTYRVGVIACLQ